MIISNKPFLLQGPGGDLRQPVCHSRLPPAEGLRPPRPRRHREIPVRQGKRHPLLVSDYLL